MFCDNNVSSGRTRNMPTKAGSPNKVSLIKVYLLVLCRTYGTKTGDNAACFA